MFTTSATLSPNMSFEDLAEQIVAVTAALELIKDLQPVEKPYDDGATKYTSTSTSWISSSASKEPTPTPRKPYVSDLPALQANQHPIVLSIWARTHSLTSYKATLAGELMELIKEKRQHARSLELARIKNRSYQE